jgi:hypothetical protein
MRGILRGFSGEVSSLNVALLRVGPFGPIMTRAIRPYCSSLRRARRLRTRPSASCPEGKRTALVLPCPDALLLAPRTPTHRRGPAPNAVSGNAKYSAPRVAGPTLSLYATTTKPSGVSLGARPSRRAAPGRGWTGERAVVVAPACTRGDFPRIPWGWCREPLFWVG